LRRNQQLGLCQAFVFGWCFFLLGVCSCTKSTKILSTRNATSCTLVPDVFSNGS
jgi:hypothetical protein